MKKIKYLFILLPLLFLTSCELFNNSGLTKTADTPKTTTEEKPNKTTSSDNKSATTPNTTTEAPKTTSNIIPVTTTKIETTSTDASHVHTFSNNWETDNKFHWHASTCGHDVVDSKAEHNFETTNITDAKITMKCSICNKELEYDNTISLESLYGYKSFKTLGKKYSDFYEKLFTAAQLFSASNIDVSDTKTFQGEAYYIIDTLDYTGLTDNEATSVWNIFVLENPQFYWLNNHILTGSGNHLYLSIGDDFILSSERTKKDQKINNLVSTVSTLISNSNTEIEKYTKIHEYILNNMEYAYKSDGETPEDELWAHNIIGFIEHKKGVCECYAKTFLYLSYRFGLENIAVSGSSKGQNHMWNLAKIDNNWYHFDFTWDDSEKGISYNYFGLSNENITKDHQINDQTHGINYLYELPNSLSTLELVKIYEIEEEKETLLGYAKSLNESFEDLNEAKDYRFELINYFNRLDEKNDTIDNRIYKLSNPTKKIASLKISGVSNIGSNGEYYSPTIISPTENIILDFDVEFYNVELKSDEYTLKIKDSTTTFSGYDKINIEIIDDKGTIDSKSDILINYNKPITITNLRASLGGGRINSNAKITNFYLETKKRNDIMFGTDNTTIEITTLYAHNEIDNNTVPVLLINSVAENCKINIGSVLADDSCIAYDSSLFYFNIYTESLDYYPIFEINNDTTLDLYYIIVSSALNKTSMSGKNIIKTPKSNVSNFNLVFVNNSQTQIKNSELEYDNETSYIKLK